MAANEEIDDTEILQFNLTNPEQLTEQLKHARLDDQETDVLLKEAMRINAQLKEALRSQQLEGDGGPPPARSDKARRIPRGPPEPLAPRNPKTSTLPPIVRPGDKHGHGGSREGPRHSKPKSLVNGQRETSASKHKGSSSKSKPAWDDRFNYD